MTDPRIIECAKALNRVDAADTMAGREDLDACCARRWVDMEENYIALATACVLKWLEQNVTAAMVDAGFEGLKPRVNQPAKTFTGTTPDAVYTAMCEQAKKEIAG